MIAPGSDGTAKVVAQLGDGERIRKARVHPIAVLAALRTYGAGHGVRGRGVVEPGPGGRRRARRGVLHGVRERRADRQAAAARARRVGLDGLRSGRRRAGAHAAGCVGGARAGDRGDRVAYEMVGFFAGRGGFAKRGGGRFAGRTDGLTPLSISPRQRLDDAVEGRVEPAVRRHRLRAADAVRAGAASGRSTRS